MINGKYRGRNERKRGTGRGDCVNMEGTGSGVYKEEEKELEGRK